MSERDGITENETIGFGGGGNTRQGNNHGQENENKTQTDRQTLLERHRDDTQCEKQTTSDGTRRDRGKQDVFQGDTDGKREGGAIRRTLMTL